MATPSASEPRSRTAASLLATVVAFAALSALVHAQGLDLTADELRDLRFGTASAPTPVDGFTAEELRDLRRLARRHWVATASANLEATR